jgi:6-phosphogluconolactonase
MIVAPFGQVSLCADPPAVAHRMAEIIVAAAGKAIDQRGAFVIALAGGSSPRAAYEYLALPAQSDAVDWSRVLCLFGDERCVPPDNADSNFRMANETLLSKVAVAQDNILRMRGEDAPAEAADAYQAQLLQRLGDDPVIDLVLLGLGPDAHTASWFPDVVIDESKLVDAPYVPKFKSNRLTMTTRLINNAREIVVATSGSEKADALAAALGSDRNPLHIPSQRLDPKNGSLTWLVDKDAAAKL